jgi:hypothetical protein
MTNLSTPDSSAENSGAPAPVIEPGAAGRRIDRTLVVVLVAIGTLVAIALVVIFSRGPATPLDANSPQGVVQRYVAAVVAGDEQQASSFLSDDWLANCDVNQLYPTEESMRVTLVSTTERPDSADVHVLITTTYQGDIFGSGSSSSEAVFDLVKFDQRWKIDTAPWELAVCPSAGVTQ